MVAHFQIASGDPPFQGVVKINFDASFNHVNHQAFAGIVARDYLGNFIASHSSCFVASSPFVAEAIAPREAANWARNMGLGNVVFESDNLDLVNTYRKEIARDEISGYVKDIIQIKEEGVGRGFTWVPRKGNEAAHLIAKLASRSSFPRG